MAKASPLIHMWASPFISMVSGSQAKRVISASGKCVLLFCGKEGKKGG